ncbi:MAG: RelA/SpoT family protein [Ureaplasma sp.]|nr:RelA/SpoT family protein [Ureaplasma sp.]
MNNEQIIKNTKQKLINKLIDNNFSEDDIKKIETGIDFAIKHHDGQFRKSGEPYVIHPIETAIILVDWEMDTTSIISGLLHDLIEDTDVTKEDIEKEFGEEIAYIVDILSKVSDTIAKKRKEEKIADNTKKQETNADIDYFIKIFFSMAKDIRVAVVKLADRTHNISTIQFLPIEKQERIARETINLYANLAGRIGMYSVKTNLLDSSFKVLENKEYEYIKSKIDNFIKKHINAFKKSKKKIENLLTSFGIEFQISERVKGIYSTLEKIKKNNFTLESIHDLYAIRIVTNDVLECYKILGLIHTNFKVLKKTFNDFIANPKRNLYQSIHTTLIVSGANFEVQIRTKKMDEVSKYGAAAHWKYKENVENKNSTEFVAKFLDYTEAVSNNEFERKVLINNEEIFDVYVADEERFDSIIVNQSIRAIDIAFRFNSEKFRYLSSISVNGIESPFDKVVNKNDTIYMNYTDKVETINKKWISYSNEDNTKKYILEYLRNKENFNIQNIEEFYKNIEKELKGKWLGKEKTKEIITREFGYENVNNFFNEISKSYFSINLFYRLFSINKTERVKNKKKLSLFFSRKLLNDNFLLTETPIEINGVEFSTCCNKCLGIEILGFLSDNKLIVHNVNCENILKLNKKYKMIPLLWNEKEIINQRKRFLCSIKFKYQWSENAGNEVSYWVNKLGMAIHSLTVSKPIDEICEINVTLFTDKEDKINNWILKLKSTNNLKEIIKI